LTIGNGRAEKGLSSELVQRLTVMGVLGLDILADEGSEGVEGVSSLGHLVGFERRSILTSLLTRMLAMSTIESSSFFMVSIRVT